MMCYFITFRTYGTWLHGDERGSVDQKHNQVGTPLLEADARLQQRHRQMLQTPAVVLNDGCCACVEGTLHEVARHRGWTIHALCVLSNHVHVVVQTPEQAEKANPEKVMNDFKAYATRRLREMGEMSEVVRVWEHHGSTRYLKSEESLASACHYVLHCQTSEPQA